jgi:hypothetical protein
MFVDLKAGVILHPLLHYGWKTSTSHCPLRLLIRRHGLAYHKLGMWSSDEPIVDAQWLYHSMYLIKQSRLDNRSNFRNLAHAYSPVGPPLQTSSCAF